MRLVPVVLCGGSGTRLWPLSRSFLPKQFLPLLSTRSMLQETLGRLEGLEGVEAPIAIANEEHRFLAAEQLREIGCVPRALLLEPVGRNTAPAVAAAALQVAADSVLLVLPADHSIVDLPQLHAAIRAGAKLAGDGKLVVFGIPPKGPHTGYGYIKRGAALGGGAFSVERFVEKPSLDKAQAFVSNGGYLWNSGMFLFRADRYLAELGAARPEIVSGVRAALDAAQRDLEFVRLDKDRFTRVPSVSIDYAVMERTRDAAVVTAGFGWSDIGSWSALWEVDAKDATGNSVRGDVYLDQASGCYVRAEDRFVAAVGVKDLVIVETDDAVLVAHKDRAEDVKQAVEHLKANKRDEHITHSRVYRPWGYYEALDDGAGYQVKRLMVKPGARISLQRHAKRAEHWVVVSGRAKVTRGEQELLLGANESTYIPLGTKHRLENVGTEPLFVIEVQSGTYLGEDDIERFGDDYRRT